MSSEFHLPASCTIVNINSLYEQLETLATSQQDAVINASQVASIDTAALQTLAAFIQHQHEAGLTAHITSSSCAFTEAVQELGMSKALGAH